MTLFLRILLQNRCTPQGDFLCMHCVYITPYGVLIF